MANLLLGLVVLLLTYLAMDRFRKGTLVGARQMRSRIFIWVSFLFVLTALLFVTHAFVEVVGLGEGLYAVTGLVTMLLLGFTVVLFDIGTELLWRRGL